MKTHINILIKPLLSDLLKKKTENVVDFAIEWFKTKGKKIEQQRKD